MNTRPDPLDLSKVKVLPLANRDSLSAIESLLGDPAQPATPLTAPLQSLAADVARRVRGARARGASVMLLYGAHLVKNGAHRIVNALVERGWITHLATNGAGIIHDWELSFLGRTEESVRDNVATGTFGTWDETGRNIHLAILAGALVGDGFGLSLGRFIMEEGVTLPTIPELEHQIRAEPSHPFAPARAGLLVAMRQHQLPAGRIEVKHAWKDTSMIANAFRHSTPFTVHPGIGYDIISNHPMFNGAAIGRAAALDFALFGGSVERLDGGVVLSVGSAVMAPQVFEKSLSCVNNLRLQAGHAIVRDHTMFVVDLQDGGGWDWSQGEPPRDNPAYYLRFCKTFSRMGGEMKYVQCDNVAFLHNVLQRIEEKEARTLK